MPRKKTSCVNETKIMNNGMKATCIAYRLAKDIYKGTVLSSFLA